MSLIEAAIYARHCVNFNYLLLTNLIFGKTFRSEYWTDIAQWNVEFGYGEC